MKRETLASKLAVCWGKKRKTIGKPRGAASLRKAFSRGKMYEKILKRIHPTGESTNRSAEELCPAGESKN